jgi:hypothetical protein
MRTLVTAVAVVLLQGVACSTSPQSAAPAPAASGAGAGGAGATRDACRALTPADVRTALGVDVNQLPMTSAPPGGGPDSSFVSGCTYAAASATDAGVSLYLFRDMPIGYFATVPGFQHVPGVGDTAFMRAPMLVGQKGSLTFQLVLVTSADEQGQDQELTTLARAVAGRL